MSAESSLNEIRHRTDLVALIGEHVKLEAAGRDMRGPCPFHPDEGKNFYVARAKFYYCFECEVSGDCFQFLMRLQDRKFWDVARCLAKLVDVELEPPVGRVAHSQKDTGHGI